MVLSEELKLVDEDAAMLLNEMLSEDSYFTIKKNNGKRYQGERKVEKK